MEIYLNGQPQQIHDDAMLTELIDSLNLAGHRFAVEVNLEVVPRSIHPNYRLHPNDRVEIVHAIGGG